MRKRVTTMPQLPRSDVIEHHGINGMHWGVRRTPEQLGHPRSSRKERRAAAKAENDVKRRNAAIGSRSAKTVRKGVDQLSDEELRARLNRIQMEVQLKDLERRQKPEVQRMMEDILKEVGKQEVKRVLQKEANKATDAIMSEIRTAVKKQVSKKKKS